MDLVGHFLFGRGNSGNRKGNGSWVNAQERIEGRLEMRICDEPVAGMRQLNDFVAFRSISYC